MTVGMSSAEKQAFLAEVHVGVVSIPRAGQGPLTVPVWYQYEPDESGGMLWFLTGRESRKGKQLSVDCRISLCAQSEQPPYKYVSVEGPVIRIDSPEGEILPMAVRYLGEELGRSYAEASEQEDNIVVRMQPENWLAVDYAKLNP